MTKSSPVLLNKHLLRVLGLSHISGTAQRATIVLTPNDYPKITVQQTTLHVQADKSGDIKAHCAEYEMVGYCDARMTTRFVDRALTRVTDYIDEAADIEIAFMAYDHAERDREFFRKMDTVHAAIRRQLAIQGLDLDAARHPARSEFML